MSCLIDAWDCMSWYLKHSMLLSFCFFWAQFQPSGFIASGGLPSSTSADDGQSQLAIPGPSGVNVDPVPDYDVEPQGAGLAENEQTQQQVNYLRHCIVVSRLEVSVIFLHVITRNNTNLGKNYQWELLK